MSKRYTFKQKLDLLSKQGYELEDMREKIKEKKPKFKGVTAKTIVNEFVSDKNYWKSFDDFDLFEARQEALYRGIPIVSKEGKMMDTDSLIAKLNEKEKKEKEHQDVIKDVDYRLKYWEDYGKLPEETSVSKKLKTEKSIPGWVDSPIDLSEEFRKDEEIEFLYETKTPAFRLDGPTKLPSFNLEESTNLPSFNLEEGTKLPSINLHGF